MSGRWPDRSSAQALFRPPRRAFLAIGTVAVPSTVLAGGDPATAGLVGSTAFMLFFMGHVERKMHSTGPRRTTDPDPDRRSSAADNTSSTAQKTTTTIQED